LHFGCAKLPEGRSAIDDVSVRGARAVDDGDLMDTLATAPSPKFLGLFRGLVYEYEIYDRSLLERDLGRVERYYRARGYYNAHARAGRVRPTSSGHVRIEIVVEEGVPVRNAPLQLRGLDELPEDLQKETARAGRRKLKDKRVFDEDDFKAAETDIVRALTDRGYAYAKAQSEVQIDVVGNVATTTITVVPGPRAVFGVLTFQGLSADGSKEEPSEIPEAPLRRAMQIDAQAPYSTAAIDAAQQALLELGVFSAVEIKPELPAEPGDHPVIPITVRLTPTTLRQVRLGGGVEFDQIKTDVHLLSSWEDRNFLGGLRSLRVQFKPGVVLYPTRISYLEAPNRLLPEARFNVLFKQPAFPEARTSLFFRPEANVFPMLLRTTPGEDDSVLGYRELKASLGLERVVYRVFASLGHNVQVENPFSYKGPLDADLRTLVISYPELVTRLSLVDDAVRPRKGVVLSNILQVAGGPFQGDATDVKVQPEVRAYLPIGRRFTFASRATVGLLYPTGYGQVVQDKLQERTTLSNRAERVRDIETVFFRGFFAGGSNSNRGFPIRAISPHGVVPFLNPGTASQQVALNCNPSAENNFNPDPTLCSISIGGFSLWEFSNELRFKISGPISGAVFCDMADVSGRTSNIRLTHLHLSCGAGGRYDTPVGPIRVDIGYRIQPAQVLGFPDEDKAVASDPSLGVQPKFEVFDLRIPVALAFGVGEAF